MHDILRRFDLGSLRAPEGGGAARMIINETEDIYGHEFHAWLRQSRFSSSKITLVLDACHSEGFLDLPHTYQRGSAQGRQSSRPETSSGNLSSQIIQISSSRVNERAQNIKPMEKQGAVYGALTWTLLEHLKESAQQNLRQLSLTRSTAFHAMRGIGLNREGTQIAVISSSRKIKGKIGIL